MTITDLGTLNPGGLINTDTAGYAINADGSVVAGSSQTPVVHTHAARWSRTGGLQDLGTLGGYDSWAYGINADGSVLIGMSWSFQNGRSRAFRWDPLGGMQNLGTLPGGDESYAWAVSDDGSVVVGQSSHDGNSSNYAFRWTSAGGMQSLGSPTPLGGSIANAISADGLIIAGDTSAVGGGAHAFRWTSQGGMQDIGSLGDDSHAEAISANGEHIVGYAYVPGSLTRHGFLWGRSMGMRDLGTFAGGQLIPKAVSNDGAMVLGGTDLTTGGGSAVYWNPAQGSRDLNVVLPALGLDLSDWHLGQITGMNSHGDLVGWGGHHGYLRGFVITGCVAPTITQEPVDVAARADDTVQFVVAATGGGTLSYQWQHLGVNLTDDSVVSGSSTPTLTIASVRPSDAGEYRAVVLMGCGAAVTTTATLSVICSPDFNGDGDLGTDADIAAFFACLGGSCCPTCGSADFNGDGNLGTDEDIAAFFRVLAGGGC